MLPVAVAQSSSGGNAIHYVPLVLWKMSTSCFHIMEQIYMCTKFDNSSFNHSRHDWWPQN